MSLVTLGAPKIRARIAPLFSLPVTPDFTLTLG
jgi:hypothetical protein